MDLPTLSAADCAVNQWPSNRGPGVRLLAVPLPALFVLGASHLKSRNHTGCSPACCRKCKVPPEWLSQLSSCGHFREQPKTLADAKQIADTVIDYLDPEWLLRFGLDLAPEMRVFHSMSCSVTRRRKAFRSIPCTKCDITPVLCSIPYSVRCIPFNLRLIGNWADSGACHVQRRFGAQPLQDNNP